MKSGSTGVNHVIETAEMIPCGKSTGPDLKPIEVTWNFVCGSSAGNKFNYCNIKGCKMQRRKWELGII